MLLGAITWFTNLSVDEAFGSDWDPYLLLLGGPFAAGVLAKGLTVARSGPTSAAGIGRVTEAGQGAVGMVKDDTEETAEPSLSDIGKSNDGNSSLPDTQYVVFSLVAVVYFLGAFVHNLLRYVHADEKTITLPQIPSALLGLTSLAAATYVGAKAVESHGVRVTSMQLNPYKVPSKELLSITLVNASTTTAAGTIRVTFALMTDGVPGTPTTRSPEKAPKTANGMTTFKVEVPVLEPGSYQVVVTTPDGTTPVDTLVLEAA